MKDAKEVTDGIGIAVDAKEDAEEDSQEDPEEDARSQRDAREAIELIQ